MSATENLSATESRISAKAFDLLDCFVSGLDDVIYKTAENLARMRSPQGAPTQIEVQDIESAARQVIAAIRQRISTGEIPNELAPVIDRMEKCLKLKKNGATTGA